MERTEMASWTSRKRADGGTSVQIRWRQEGRWQSETFTSVRLASEFRTAVETAGHAWPEDWEKGNGWQTPQAPVEALTEPIPVVMPDDPEEPEDEESERSFADVALSYFTEQGKRIRRGRVKPYTVHRAKRTYALHLEEFFGHLPFIGIEDTTVEDWIEGQLDIEAAPKSVRNRHGLLSSIMKHGAGRMKLRVDNPCSLSELPVIDAAVARQIRFLQHGEWALFRSGLNPDVHLMADVKLATGMRFGEVSAIRAGDITFSEDDRAVLHIVRAWSSRAPDDPAEVRWSEGENVSWVLGPPKGLKSRYVTVDGPLARQLRQSLTERGTDDYVFVTRHGNPWRYPDFHTDRWAPAQRAAKRLGLSKRTTIHMLRHTAVVWSLAEGVRIEMISQMLGHRSIQITYDIYGGVINLQDPVMAEAMSRAMLASAQSIVPLPSPSATVTALRPGRRGESRRRAG
jgi:integrase